ncbi:hypothetical protein [Horticoccus sp. 23ND18S-11]|uniref:hypothetical protein n=1 Tax=Horticoccus sp. 23ND18S-11 TaxID=3391832 RepID=UPI0039C994B5
MKKALFSVLLILALITVFYAGRQSATKQPTAAGEPKATVAKTPGVALQPKETVVARSADASLNAGISEWESGKHKLPPALRLDREAANSDPRSESFRAKARERWVEHAYGAAFKKLNLTDFQIARMRELLAMRERSLSEFDSLAGKSSANGEVISEARQASVQGVDQKIADLIGRETYAELKSLRKRSVSNLSQAYTEAGLDLSMAGLPLSEDQAKALTDIYGQRRPMPGAEASSKTALPADLQVIFEKAQQHMSKDQLDVFLTTLRWKAEHERFIAHYMVPAK